MELTDQNQAQLAVIQDLFDRCENENMHFWLYGGWAIDALLGTVTRNHSDIDILVHDHSREALRSILSEMGRDICDNGSGWFYKKNDIGMDIGFLLTLANGTVVSDVDSTDPNVYPWPTGSFPLECNANLPGFACRAISWEAQYVAKAGFRNAFPDTALRVKDEADLKIVLRHITDQRLKRIEETLFGGIPRNICKFADRF